MTGTPHCEVLADVALDMASAAVRARDEARTDAAYYRAVLAGIQSQATAALDDETADVRYVLAQVDKAAADALWKPPQPSLAVT